MASLEPYECVLEWSMTVETKDHYQLTVTAIEAFGEERTADEVFALSDATPLVIRLD